MTEKTVVLSRPLIVGHKRDGRCGYDPEAKRELIEACLRSSVSVARVALDHGINANLLRKWISAHPVTGAPVTTPLPLAVPAFAPVLSVSAPRPQAFALSVVLPNGVRLELQGLRLDDLCPLLSGLAGLPCSASNRG